MASNESNGDKSAQEAQNARILELCHEAVLVESSETPDTPEVVGYDFNKGVCFEALMASYLTTGFQATNVARAIEEINKMIAWRLSDEEIEEDAADEERDAEFRAKYRCKIYLGFTSNMVSSGMREVIRYLVEHRMVDVVVCTAGGIEEDLIKVLAPTHLGAFHLRGEKLRKRGLNRIGNLLIPNDNYCMFQDWIFPILDAMQAEQENEGVNWTPSKMIARLGKEIASHERCNESILYHAWRQNVQIQSPALTDGSIGDMLFFHSFQHEHPIRLDIVADLRDMNLSALNSKRTGAIILGGGLVKHHIMNANLMRNGCDYAIFVNTAQSFDGSDAGATPDEAVSWGKIRAECEPVKINAEATLIFPLLVAMTFAKNWEPKEDAVEPRC